MDAIAQIKCHDLDRQGFNRWTVKRSVVSELIGVPGGMPKMIDVMSARGGVVHFRKCGFDGAPVYRSVSGGIITVLVGG